MVIGELSSEHCQRWGLNTGVKLVSGATDSNAAFYASGAGEPESGPPLLVPPWRLREFLNQELMIPLGVSTVTGIPMDTGCLAEHPMQVGKFCGSIAGAFCTGDCNKCTDHPQ